MAFAISSRLAQIGSSGGNSGRGASARRRSISAGENAINFRRPRENERRRVSRNGQAGTQTFAQRHWIPAFAGMTVELCRSFPAQQALGVARERVHFQIDTVADAQMPQSGLGQRVRNEVHLEFSAPYRVHREAYSVHGDRALARDVAGKVRRRADAKQAVFAHRFEAHDLPDAVDVAENEVAVEPVGKRERLLQVDLSRFVQPDGTAERLAGNIDAEAFPSALHYGEAYAVGRDAVADLDVVQAQFACVDGEAQTALCRLDLADFSDGGYDSGKHG